MADNIIFGNQRSDENIIISKPTISTSNNAPLEITNPQERVIVFPGGNVIVDLSQGDARYVRFDSMQVLSDTQQNRARTNIDAEPAFTKNTAFNKNFGTTSGTVVEGNDARLLTVSQIQAIPNDRNIEKDAVGDVIGTVKNTGFNKDFGTIADTVAQGNDSRFLSDAQKGELIGGASTSLHFHDTDRDRSNHTGTQLSATISDFQTTVSANTDVTANTALTTTLTGIANDRIIEKNVSGTFVGVAKNNAYNNIYGTTSGTVAQGNDSRFLTDGQKTTLTTGVVADSLHTHASAGLPSTVAYTDQENVFTELSTFQNGLIVEGTFTRSNVQDLDVSDNVLLLNSGETGDGISLRFAGIQLDRGQGDDTALLYDESDDLWKIGTFNTITNDIVAATASTITLNTEAPTEDDVLNNMLMRVFKAGEDSQVRTITDYDGTTKVATITPNFNPVPDNTWDYRVITNSNLQVVYNGLNANNASTPWTASNFISATPTGTQPYAASSTTLNTNLNADLLDGMHASAFAQTGDLHNMVTLAGFDYLGISNQQITANFINLGSHVTGVLPIIHGGTGSSTKNFVDLTTTQSVGGFKSFTGNVLFQQLTTFNSSVFNYGQNTNTGERFGYSVARGNPSDTMVWHTVRGGTLEISQGNTFSTTNSEIIALNTGSSPSISVGGNTVLHGGNANNTSTNWSADTLTANRFSLGTAFSGDLNTLPDTANTYRLNTFTSSATNRPTGVSIDDGYIQTFRWPTSNLATQIALHSSSDCMAIRYRDSMGDWQDWQTIYNGDNANTTSVEWTTSRLNAGIANFSTAYAINSSGSGLALRNDHMGNNDGFSSIQNTGTGSMSNLVFSTGTGVAMTINHDRTVNFTNRIANVAYLDVADQTFQGNIRLRANDASLYIEDPRNNGSFARILKQGNNILWLNSADNNTGSGGVIFYGGGFTTDIGSFMVRHSGTTRNILHEGIANNSNSDWNCRALIASSGATIAGNINLGGNISMTGTNTTLNLRPSGTGGLSIGFGTGSGSLLYYGGGTSIMFQVNNQGNATFQGTGLFNNTLTIQNPNPTQIFRDTDLTGAGKFYRIISASGRLNFQSSPDGGGTSYANILRLTSDRRVELFTDGDLRANTSATGFVVTGLLDTDTLRVSTGATQGMFLRATNSLGDTEWADVNTGGMLTNVAYLDMANNFLTRQTITVNYASSQSLNNAQLILRGASDNAQRLLVGYETTNDHGLIQAIRDGVGFRNLILNPNGGNVGIGTTDANTTERLTVNGNLSVTGAGSFSSNVSVGNVLTFANASSTPSPATEAIYSPSGSGGLRIQAGAGVEIVADDDNSGNGEVILRSHTAERLRTTNGGISVTGTVDADLYQIVNGNGANLFQSFNGSVVNSPEQLRISHSNEDIQIRNLRGNIQHLVSGSTIQTISSTGTLVTGTGTFTNSVIGTLGLITEGDVITRNIGTNTRYHRFTDTTLFRGGYLAYNGTNTRFSIGVHNPNTNVASDDQDAIEIVRSTGAVELNHGGNTRLETTINGISVTGDTYTSGQYETTFNALTNTTTQHLNIRTLAGTTACDISTNNVGGFNQNMVFRVSEGTSGWNPVERFRIQTGGISVTGRTTTQTLSITDLSHTNGQLLSIGANGVVSAVDAPNQSSNFETVIVENSGWNMQSVASRAVTLPQSYAIGNISSVDVTIFNDSGNAVVNYGALQVQWNGPNTSSVLITRTDNSVYDSEFFNDGTVLRVRLKLTIDTSS